MFTPMRCRARLAMIVLGGVLAIGIVTGPSAFARGGHGGGGHGGGGHGGHCFRGHYFGGLHHGGFAWRGYGHRGYGHRGYGRGGNSGGGGGGGYGGADDGYGLDDGGLGYGDFDDFYGFPDTYADYGFVLSAARSGLSSVGAVPAVDPAWSRQRYLGIQERPVDGPDGRGMEVTEVYPGTAAEQAGLRVGDVIESINGYLTTRSGNLYWIIHNAAPNGVLDMHVRTASDGAVHVIVARLF